MQNPPAMESETLSEKISVLDMKDNTDSARSDEERAEESPETTNNGDQRVEPIVARPWFVLPAIVSSQFAGTALWFAGNAVLPDLSEAWGLPDSSLGLVTSSVQLGFIGGTLIFALLNIADRFLPTYVFMICALLGASLNALIPLCDGSLAGLLFLRFATGVSLAGIYPVGMKVASDWYETGLGKALGWLVGALALGSSFPFLLRQIPQSWQALLYETSSVAAIGGVVVGCLVPNGPYRKAAGKKLDPKVVWTIFQDPLFRSAALAYWGHMWELYAFWTWCPVVWEAYLEEQGDTTLTPSIVTFLVIALGGLGCVLGGYASTKYGSAWVAFGSLATSGLLCTLSPLVYEIPVPGIVLVIYLVWGMAVVADSPQFSTLVAMTAPPESKGTALTIVNCLGFAITIASIQLLAVDISEQFLFLLLAPGPLFGLWSLRAHVNPFHATEVKQDKLAQEEEEEVDKIGDTVETSLPDP